LVTIVYAVIMTVANLARVLCAGVLVNLDRDVLADRVFQLRGLGVAYGYQLEGLCRRLN
jgi:hypothetical protein